MSDEELPAVHDDGSSPVRYCMLYPSPEFKQACGVVRYVVIRPSGEKEMSHCSWLTAGFGRLM